MENKKQTPKRLTAIGKHKYNRLAKELQQPLTEAVSDLLAIAAESYEKYRKANKELSEYEKQHGTMFVEANGTVKTHPASVTARQYYTLYISTVKRLGLLDAMANEPPNAVEQWRRKRGLC